MPTIPLKYFGYHPYNNPTHSERNVELPMAFWFLEKFQHDPANIIEVGEVTPFYRRPRHAVFDPVPEFPATTRESAINLDYQGKHLLSISTLEHVGTSDYGQKPDDTLLPKILCKMLASENYLITFALGYNRQLEELAKKERHVVLERTALTKWRQIRGADFGAYQYHSPWYAGNGLCVLTNLEELHFEFSRRSTLAVVGRCRAPQWSWKNFIRGTWREISDQRVSTPAAIAL